MFVSVQSDDEILEVINQLENADIDISEGEEDNNSYVIEQAEKDTMSFTPE